MFCAAQLAGCNGRGTAQDDRVEFLKELDDQALITVLGDGVGVFVDDLVVSRAYAKATKERGVDPMAAYKLISEVQIKAAYVLLLQESKEYLAYADKHIEKLLAGHEFLAWISLINRENNGISDRYREAMMGILKKVDAPQPQTTVARDMIKKGDLKNAIAKLLSIHVPAREWTIWVEKAFGEMDKTEKFTLLLPYLDSQSIQGVRAAVILADESEYRERAIKYLNAMKKSDDPQLKEAAEWAVGPVPEKNIPPLIEMLKDTGEDIRLFAAQSLGNIGPAAEEAIPALKKVLKDEDSEVRDAAARAIRKIQGKEPSTPSSD